MGTRDRRRRPGSLSLYCIRDASLWEPLAGSDQRLAIQSVFVIFGITNEERQTNRE